MSDSDPGGPGGSAEGPQPPVRYAVEGGVATLTLNRPARANAMDLDLLVALHAAAVRAHGDPGVRAVVLSGAGRNFCAGGDVKVFAAKGEDLPAYLNEATWWLSLCVAALQQLHAPVVAAVQGWAAGGGGLGLVCAADVVVAAQGARFASGAVAVGMAPDAGVSVLLPQLIGVRRAQEVLLEGRTLTADEALEAGLVNAVVPDADLLSAATERARRFLASAPAAITATKHLLWSGLGTTVADRLPQDARVVADLSGTADAREGLAAVIERRPPRFGPGRP